MAFAQPYFPSNDKNPQAENVYIYLDNSSSMSNRVDGSTTSLHLGLDYVSKILDLYPTNTSYKFLTNEFAPFSNTLKSKNEIKEKLTEIKLSNLSRTFPEAYNRLNSHTLRQTAGGKDIFIISDFQKSTIGNIAQIKTDSLDQVFISPIFFEATKNIFIDSMYLSNPFLLATEKNQLNVVLKNSGHEDATDLQVKLFINEIQYASSIIDIPSESAKEINFEIRYNLENINKCRINFEDFPVTFDNDFYFVLRLENKINILEIKNQDVVSPIQKVYGNKHLFSYSSQVASNMDYSLIGQFDLVIVNGLQEIDNSLTLELNNYIESGGSIFIIPGTKPVLSSYKNLVATLNLTTNDTSQVDISMPDLSDPFYENIFESNNEQIDMPHALPLLTWRGQQYNLLKFRNNLNFFSGFKNLGTIFILASPLDDHFTNFHRHALFVPVMYRLAAISKKSFNSPYYSINELTIDLKLDSLNKRDIYKLTNKETELIPNQRISAGRLILEMPHNTLNPGFYELTLERKTKNVLAFNLEKAESYLEQMKNEEIKSNFSAHKNVIIFQANDVDKFSNEVKKNKIGIPLWKYAIILSLLFLMIEVLLIRFL